MSLSDSPVLIPLPGRAHLQLTGADRATFLHNFCTNDIKGLPPGQGCEAFVCNVKGRVLGHIHVFAADDSLWIDSVPGSSEKLLAHLDRYLIREDVQFHNRTAEFTDVLLTGPQVAERLTAAGHPECGDLLPLRTTLVRLHDTDVVVRRMNWLPQPTFVLVLPVHIAETVTDELLQHGFARGGLEEWESLRIAAGFPEYGIDITEDHLAQEIARTTQAISFTKGCYLGQEPIARIDALGHVNRELRRFIIAGDALPTPDSPLLDAAGHEVGQLTSIARAPDGHGGVAMGYVRVKAANTGARFRASNIDIELANANV